VTINVEMRALTTSAATVTQMPQMRRGRELDGREFVDPPISPPPHCEGVRGGVATSIERNTRMNGIIYLVGLVVVVLFILSFLGLR
jgi:hypothetical protein